jgi:MFS family permease
MSSVITLDRRTASLIALAGFGVFFAATDQTSVVAVLPKMIAGIGLPQDRFYRAAWIVNGYILGYVVAMPLMGRVADIFGHGRIFALAMLIFIAGSAWVALSQSLTSIAAARAFQAIGGGALVPVAIAIVADALPQNRRAVGIGAMAAAAEAGGLIGPLWGGGIAEVTSWRGLFWLNVPVCLPIVLAVLAIDRQRNPPPATRIDYAGAALIGLSLVCLTVALTDDPIQRRPIGLTLAFYGAAAVTFGLFLVRQAKVSEPLLKLQYFLRPQLAAGLLTNGLVGGVLVVAMVGVPLFTNAVLQGSAIEGGVNLVRLTAGLPLGALAGGFLCNRLGFSRTAVLGLVLAAFGFYAVSRWSADPGPVALTLPLFAAGLGLGLVIAPIGAAVVNQVEEGERATVSSLLTVARLLGALVGVALLTTRGLGGFYAQAGLIPLENPGYVDLLQGLELGSFHHTFLATAIVCLGAAIPALFLGNSPG